MPDLLSVPTLSCRRSIRGRPCQTTVVRGLTALRAGPLCATALQFHPRTPKPRAFLGSRRVLLAPPVCRGRQPHSCCRSSFRAHALAHSSPHSCPSFTLLPNPSPRPCHSSARARAGPIPAPTHAISLAPVYAARATASATGTCTCCCPTPAELLARTPPTVPPAPSAPIPALPRVCAEPNHLCSRRPALRPALQLPRALHLDWYLSSCAHASSSPPPVFCSAQAISVRAELRFCVCR
jgi:hypothetical protein